MDTVVEIIRIIFQWGAACFIAYCFLLAVQALAGRQTDANLNLGVRVLGNVAVNRGVISLLTASGWVYGLGQRAMRRRHIKRHTEDKNKLERVIDPNRTSSNLTTKGTTPKKEKG
jgi:hypothetical protein